MRGGPDILVRPPMSSGLFLAQLLLDALKIFQPFDHLFLETESPWRVELSSLESCGHGFLGGNFLRKIMVVLVTFAVIESFHQWRWRIAQMQRHRQRTRRFN